MDNVSALSVSIAAPQGRAGPGTWGQGKTEGFIDFISALISRSETPAAAKAGAARSETGKSAEQPVVIWTAPKAGAAPVNEAVISTDTDVGLVVSPQSAESQEDLLRLIALLLGEEENDGFLFALMQYIQETPKLADAFKSIAISEDNEAKVLSLPDYLLLMAQEIPGKEDIPPELAPLENLITLLAPETPAVETDAVPAIQAEPAATAPAEQAGPGKTEVRPVLTGQPQTEPVKPEQPETALKAETVKTEAVKTETVKMEAAEAETVKTAEKTAPKVQGEAREIPDTVRVTEIKIAPPRRAAYTNPFSAALRPVQMSASPVIAFPGAVEQPLQAETLPETEPAYEEAAVWDLTDEETPAAPVKQERPPGEKAGMETKTDAKPVEAPSPQTVSAQPVQAGQTAAQIEQTPETAPARQALAAKIIDQISAQMANSRDVSTIQMELNPKFLGKIQLVIEASAEGITARLRSDNGAVRSLLNEHIADLRNTLKEAGVNMKDIEITESRVGTELSDRRRPQEGFETAGERKGKIGGISAVTALRETENAEPAMTAYSMGRVSGAGSLSQFDYRA